MQYHIFGLNLRFWYSLPNFCILYLNLNQMFITVIRMKLRVCNSPNNKKINMCLYNVHAWLFCINGCTEGKKGTQNLWQLNLSMKRDSDIGDLRLQVLSCISSPLLLYSMMDSRLFELFLVHGEFRACCPSSVPTTKTTKKYWEKYLVSWAAIYIV